MNDHDLLLGLAGDMRWVRESQERIENHTTKRMNWIEGKIDKHTNGHWWRVALISGTVIGAAIGILVAYAKLLGA